MSRDETVRDTFKEQSSFNCEEIGGLRQQMHAGGERGQRGFIAPLQFISAAVLENSAWVVVLQMAEVSLLCNEMPRWRYLELSLIKL